MQGIRTDGPMAPDIDISNARKAVDVHATQVEAELEKIKIADPEGYARATRAAEMKKAGTKIPAFFVSSQVKTQLRPGLF
jgi:hypothetical protein